MKYLYVVIQMLLLTGLVGICGRRTRLESFYTFAGNSLKLGCDIMIQMHFVISAARLPVPLVQF